MIRQIHDIVFFCVATEYEAQQPKPPGSAAWSDSLSVSTDVTQYSASKQTPVFYGLTTAKVRQHFENIHVQLLSPNCNVLFYAILSSVHVPQLAKYTYSMFSCGAYDNEFPLRCSDLACIQVAVDAEPLQDFNPMLGHPALAGFAVLDEHREPATQRDASGPLTHQRESGVMLQFFPLILTLVSIPCTDLQKT